VVHTEASGLSALSGELGSKDRAPAVSAHDATLQAVHHVKERNARNGPAHGRRHERIRASSE
jgi:hypothetical protein